MCEEFRPAGERHADNVIDSVLIREQSLLK